jgi:hypothetical protein
MPSELGRQLQEIQEQALDEVTAPRRIVFDDDAETFVLPTGATLRAEDGWLHVFWTSGGGSFRRSWPAHRVHAVYDDYPGGEPF